jgi:protein-L-isoaspartate(D-aspartate) O-methyltransferase
MTDLSLQKIRLTENIFEHLKSNDINRLKKAFLETERELFVPEAFSFRAYEDISLPIGLKQTISAPSTVIKMTHLLDVRESHRVLEIGTGSGYQAAILSKLAKIVYTVEIKKELFEKTKKLLNYNLRISNIKCFYAEQGIGLEEYSPFDRIILTCSAFKEIPGELIHQLISGGRLILPVETQEGVQNLYIVDKVDDYNLKIKISDRVSFVPLLRSDTDDVSISMA